MRKPTLHPLAAVELVVDEERWRGSSRHSETPTLTKFHSQLGMTDS